jgi:hypothetical protein
MHLGVFDVQNAPSPQAARWVGGVGGGGFSLAAHAAAANQ